MGYSQRAKPKNRLSPFFIYKKVWIIPQKVKIYEHAQTAFILDGQLKVMLEEDYLSMVKHNVILNASVIPAKAGIHLQMYKIHPIASQIFYAQALAVWFKRNLKQALLNHVYANKITVKGIDLNDAKINESIYHQYLKAYKKGVFNFIQEDIDLVTKERLPHKYFSGG